MLVNFALGKPLKGPRRTGLIINELNLSASEVCFWRYS